MMAFLFFFFLWFQRPTPDRGALFHEVLLHQEVKLLVLDVVPLNLVGQLLQESLLGFANLLHLQVHHLILLFTSLICVHDSSLLVDVGVLQEVLVRHRRYPGLSLSSLALRLLDRSSLLRTLVATPPLSQSHLKLLWSIITERQEQVLLRILCAFLHRQLLLLND